MHVGVCVCGFAGWIDRRVLSRWPSCCQWGLQVWLSRSACHHRPVVVIVVVGQAAPQAQNARRRQRPSNRPRRAAKTQKAWSEGVGAPKAARHVPPWTVHTYAPGPAAQRGGRMIKRTTTPSRQLGEGARWSLATVGGLAWGSIALPGMHGGCEEDLEERSEE